MTNHHDEMRVAPDPSRAEELRQRLHARLASGYRDDTRRRPAVPLGLDRVDPDEPVVPIHDVLGSIPSADTDPDLREGDIIRLETEGRPTGREPVNPRRRSPGQWLPVAAAAAVVAVVGALLVAAGGDDEDPVDTVTSTPTASTPTTAGAPAPVQDVMDVTTSNLEPGRYFIEPDRDDKTPLRVTYEIAREGWGPWFGAVKSFEGGDSGFTGLSITTVPNLVTDGCRDHASLHPPVGPTVDDLATALSRLAPFEVTAQPTDVTFLGYKGKHLELTVPNMRVTEAENYHDFADCVDGELHSWISANDDGSFYGDDASFYGYDGPGQTDEFWILDVEGTRLVLVKMASPQSPAQDIAERDAIFDSIRIEP